MYNSTFSRNPWGESDPSTTTLEELRKSIREQKVLLAATTGRNEDEVDAFDDYCDEYSSIEDLKRRITSVSKELHEKQQALANRGRTSTQSPAQWWARYQLNLRQMEDLADQRHTLLKEIGYLNSGVRSLEKELNQESEKLKQCRLKAARVKKAAFATTGSSADLDTTGMTETERIRAKAQAMVAARLNKSASTSATSSTTTSPSLLSTEDQDAQLTAHVNRLIDDFKGIQREVESIMETDMKKVDQDLHSGTKELKDRQMFEQGLYVDDYVARFIDQLDRTYTTASASSIYGASAPPGISTPPLPPIKNTTTPYYSQAPPPPIPTSQRPGTPRSAADIKAEAYKRIEERRKLFVKNTTDRHGATPASFDVKAAEDTKISEEEKAAQERMRQAETDARARLEAMREKRDTLRREAAEAEEKKRKAAAEASAAAEAEMLAEKKRKQLEEEERLAKIKKAQDALAEKQRLEREAEVERLRLEREERQQKEAKERKKREEEERIAEEVRQKKARQAAEQAAREKRLRRLEIERREKEIEAARQEEINRRKQWEEAELQKRLEEERRIKEKEEEAARARQRLEEEEARLEEQRRLEEEERQRVQMELQLQKKREEEQLLEEKRLEEQRIYQAEQQLKEEKRQEEERKQRQHDQELATAMTAAEEAERAAATAKAAYTSNYSASPTNASFSHLNSTTAGTSGYGVDVEDEVNFSIIYRVKTLYEYQGMREDDLSFSANETLKAHPSKDKGSDWWYGTSLATNAVGFFPRTYVEVVEEAFRVKTLYEFTKNRSDDLGFYENEVIVVQPFQDENSDWWYGTNEDTEESGYFPKTYVEKIDSASNHDLPSICTAAAPISIPGKSTANVYTSGNNYLTVSDSHLPRGLSAPNTPIMKKTNLGVNKQELTKRRRAASSVSTANNSHIGTPQLLFPHSGNMSENLELLTWASTMDDIELNAIPMEERKRQEAIFELIATERSYLSDLQMIINVFYTDSGKYLSQDERDVVFSNIDDLLICNTALLSDMETRQRGQANVVDKIGDVFLKHADSLQCYSTYCRNQSYATKFLQKKREDDQWFEVFLKTAQTRSECRSLDLSHFLLEPVQRITRYPLLLRQILNCTPKKHPDYALVRSALSIAQRVLEDVNEETRRFENIQKMSELSRIIDMEATGRLNITGREFILDGALFKAKSGRKLHGFLFNDILLLAEPLKALSPKGYLYTLYREPMPIESVSVRQQTTMTLKPSFGNNSADDLSFQIVSGNQVIAVKTSTATQKRQWMSQIQHYSALQQYN
ncbi:uncharacterized protein ATC70_004214 [Mucor velutinosus]|uniref:Uncharacterized protein n=1 Tax=Mucor velutinosus TaxID=708070 RepID=A0AAN7DR69_9FUNG|nr:hypothetical protein ATC70_004214 [Mucor velutinosus]